MVLKTHYIILVIIAILALNRCDWFEIEAGKPDTPQWVTKSQPEDSIETGIDAEPLEHRIFMEWHPVHNADLEGYKIFRAEIKDILDPDEKEVYSLLTKINIYHNPEYDSLYYDEDVTLHHLYRYFIRSYDYDGNMSEPSDTIEYILINKADLLYPVEGKVVSTTPEFRWRNTSITNEIVIRLEKYPVNNVVWITRFNNPDYTEGVAEKKYNFDGSAQVEELTPGQKYRWRVDCISSTNIDATDLEGSESVWQYFTVSQQ
ncbi:MAG: hypothetical protein JXQ65_06175 [Candidatus Marinimicrobia bacterium]|nr:hypothetical protein [Candidatus Neomarinimicrobiota bacterium]